MLEKGTPVLSKPDSKVHGANKGPTWVLSAPDGPHVGPMDLAIGEVLGPWAMEARNQFFVGDYPQWEVISAFVDQTD